MNGQADRLEDTVPSPEGGKFDQYFLNGDYAMEASEFWQTFDAMGLPILDQEVRDRTNFAQVQRKSKSKEARGDTSITISLRLKENAVTPPPIATLILTPRADGYDVQVRRSSIHSFQTPDPNPKVHIRVQKVYGRDHR